jgi:hypothetical protein
LERLFTERPDHLGKRLTQRVDLAIHEHARVDPYPFPRR